MGDSLPSKALRTCKKQVKRKAWPLMFLLILYLDAAWVENIFVIYCTPSFGMNICFKKWNDHFDIQIYIYIQIHVFIYTYTPLEIMLNWATWKPGPRSTHETLSPQWTVQLAKSIKISNEKFMEEKLGCRLFGGSKKNVLEIYNIDL